MKLFVALASVAAVTAAVPKLSFTHEGETCNVEQTAAGMLSSDCDIGYGTTSVATNAANVEKLALAQQAESKALRKLIAAQTTALSTLRADLSAMAAKHADDISAQQAQHDKDAADLVDAEAGYEAADKTLEAAITVVSKMVGPKGDKGEKGDDGAPGVAGAKGDKGDKGDTGPAGDSNGGAPACPDKYRLTASQLSISANAPYWNGDAAGLLGGSCCTLHFDQWKGEVTFATKGSLLDIRQFQIGEHSGIHGINYVVEGRKFSGGAWEVMGHGTGGSMATWKYPGWKQQAIRYRQTSGWRGGPWYSGAVVMNCRS